MKAGWKTTEFWFSAIAGLVGILLSSGIIEATNTVWDDKIVGLIVTGLAAFGYSVSRGMAKKTP